MKNRIPLIAAVLGALLVGGAVTGTTYAAWSDSRMMAATSANAGSIGLTVGGSQSVTFPAVDSLELNTGATPGAAHTFTTTLFNTGTGKNLKVRMYLDDVTTGNSELDAGLEISVVGAASAGSCPAPSYTPLSSTNAVQLTATPLMPAGSRVACVRLRVEGGAPSSVGAQTGTLTFSFRSQQVTS